MPPDLPTELPTPPHAVLHRLALQGLVVRSVWFPTRNELAAWDRSGCPVYIRPLTSDTVEIGPRLGAMWASVFSPVVRLELVPAGSGSRARWTRHYPRLTAGVLVFWVLVLAVWGSIMALGFGQNGLPWWTLLALVTAFAPTLGYARGGRALDDALDWVVTVARMPDDREDWM